MKASVWLKAMLWLKHQEKSHAVFFNAPPITPIDTDKKSLAVNRNLIFCVFHQSLI